jgi:hypothetical protein
MPGSRAAILEMCRDWIGYLTADRRAAWGIPQGQFDELSDLFDAAQVLLWKTTDKSERTPVIIAKCRAAFAALKAKMRFFRDRYFKMPPLSPGDWAALGFRAKDSHPTPSGDPTAEVMVETFLVGRHELGMRIMYVSGDPGDRANKGYRIWYKTVAPGEIPPTNPEQLTKSFYIRRKKGVVQFDFGDSGKTVYIAVQVENNGRKGPWGPMVTAVIP